MSEMGKTHSYNSLCKILSEVVEKAPAVRTVESYVRMLIEAHLFYSVPVFDLKDSHKLSRYAKYYPVDLAALDHHVRIVVPHAAKKYRYEWVSTFVPVEGTSDHPHEVAGLEYSSRPPEGLPWAAGQVAP